MNAGAASSRPERPERDWARYFRADDRPLELMHAYFRVHRYHPHSHDAYSFGVTEVGVQAFRCRGANRASATGMVMAFNPDDPHDGHSGAELGFEYRIAHIGPELFAEVLGDALRGGGRVALPLFREPVIHDEHAAQALLRLFGSMEEARSSRLERDERLAEAVVAMARRAGVTDEIRTPRASASALVAERARDWLEERYATDCDADELARAAGCSRYAMYRAFVARYGLSPSDYQRQCRLREARRLLRNGVPLAQAAGAVGFADQSHLTRWFVRYFGITPGAYRRAAGVDM
ncbi:AraC family transcriptional regulator [Pendulispora brunnea]|uniref:AraC family transcriptional regulator n=1 Tax=Pendulispora brunnea TaxID=2905690 RepID=A0ABZ2KMD0_9BACT